MKKKYFNKRARRRVKANRRKYSGGRRQFSKRMGGITNVSVLLENRNVNAMELSREKKEVL